MSVKARLFILFLCFMVGFVLLFVLEAYFQQQLRSTVTMPLLNETLRNKYEYALEAAVDIETATLAARLKGITDKKEIYDIIEKETDSPRFFPKDEGYYFTYTMEGVRINVPINKSANRKNLIDLQCCPAKVR